MEGSGGHQHEWKILAAGQASHRVVRIRPEVDQAAGRALLPGSGDLQLPGRGLRPGREGRTWRHLAVQLAAGPRIGQPWPRAPNACRSQGSRGCPQDRVPVAALPELETPDSRTPAGPAEGLHQATGDPDATYIAQGEQGIEAGPAARSATGLMRIIATAEVPHHPPRHLLENQPVTSQSGQDR